MYSGVPFDPSSTPAAKRAEEQRKQREESTYEKVRRQYDAMLADMSEASYAKQTITRWKGTYFDTKVRVRVDSILDWTAGHMLSGLGSPPR